MSDWAILLILFAAGAAAIALLAGAALKGWQAWLELRKVEIGSGRSAGRSPAPARRDLAELRERVRRLEAIAEGSRD